MTALKVNKRNSIGKRHSKKFIHKLNNEDDIKLFLQNLFLRKKNYNQWTYQLHGKFGLMDNFHNTCIPKNIYIYQNGHSYLGIGIKIYAVSDGLLITNLSWKFVIS